jgi:hypothetical protein
LESTADIPQLGKTVGADGKARKGPVAKRKTDDPTLATLRERAARHGLRIRKRGSEWITIDADGKSMGFAWHSAHPGAAMEDFERALPPAPTGCNLDGESPEAASAEQRAHAAEQPSDDAEASVKTRKAHHATEEGPASEQTAEPQASDAANKRIWKSKVTKVELLTMLEPIQALAFKDDEGQDFVASISDGDAAALYDAPESAKGVIDKLQTVLRLHQIEGRRKAENHAEAAPLIPDDRSIPEFRRREKDDIAGKAAA